MKNFKLIKWGITHALGVLAYIVLLALFMNNANNWFGEDDRGILAPIAMLLLFILSALVTSSLVLAKPIMLYIDGKKKEAIKLLFFTGLSIFVLVLIVFSIFLFLK